MRVLRKRFTVVLLIVLCLLVVGCAATEADVPTGDGYHTGRVVIAADGGVLFVDENGSPVVLSDRSAGGTLFDGLNTGDKVQVYYEFVAESYPAQASTAYCRFLESGTPEDIPAATRQQLAEMGWL